jgi:hypothetical protein
MLDVQHPACIVGLIARVHRGHKKFVCLEALDYILGGESLDGLPVNIMHRGKLWGSARLEIGNGRLHSEKVQRTESFSSTAVTSGGFPPHFT